MKNEDCKTLIKLIKNKNLNQLELQKVKNKLKKIEQKYV